MNTNQIVPEAETVKDWSQMVTVQTFHNLKHANPDQLSERMKPKWFAACNGAEVVKIGNTQTENGYPVSTWRFICPLNLLTGKPETMFSKTISGAENLYSVQYAHRATLPKSDTPSTLAYLAKVTVCDKRLPDKPCPPGM